MTVDDEENKPEENVDDGIRLDTSRNFSGLVNTLNETNGTLLKAALAGEAAHKNKMAEAALVMTRALGSVTTQIDLTEISRSLVVFAEQVAQTSHFQKQMIDTMKGATSILAAAMSAISRDLFSGFADLKAYSISPEEAVDVLGKYKWLLSPNMPVSFLAEIVEIGRVEGNQRGAINRLFFEYLTGDQCANLSAIVNDWKENRFFTQRMKIFRDCVVVLAKSDRSYNASNLIIPTLIAQIEGIVNPLREENGFSNGKTWKDDFRSLHDDDSIDRLASEILLDILFQSANRGKPLRNPYTFSRHKILHGEYTRYGRIDNSLRAFLILDFLHSVSSRLQ